MVATRQYVGSVFEVRRSVAKVGAVFSVQGTPSRVYGKHDPQVMFEQTSGSVEMTVTDSAESLVSVHSLVAKGHKVVFSPGGCYLKVMDKTEGSKPVRGRIAPIGDEPDLGPREPDSFDADEYVVREHNNPRKRLFAPRVKDLAVPLERIESGRLTKMIFEDDGSRREDRSMWEDKRYAMREFKHAWLGETWFKLKPERAEKGAAEEEQPSHGDEWMQDLDEAAAGGEEAYERIVEDDEDAEEHLMIDDESGENKEKAIRSGGAQPPPRQLRKLAPCLCDGARKEQAARQNQRGPEGSHHLFGLHVLHEGRSGSEQRGQ